MDRRALLVELRGASESGDTSRLLELLDHVESRHGEFKHDLTPDEESQLRSDLDRLREQKIFVLRHGEIEDYLPDVRSSLDQVLELTSETNWVNRVVNAEKREELVTMLSAVLSLDERTTRDLVHDARGGVVDFSIRVLPGPSDAPGSTSLQPHG